MSQTLNDTLRALQAASKKAASKLALCKPPFELEVGWASNYDDLFAGRVEKAVETDILTTTMRRGRCIVSGRGGGGKTQLLHRAMNAAANDGVVAILVDLKDWTAADYAIWKEWTSSDIGAGATFLLERFAQPEVDSLTLDMLPPSTKKLLVVDGLNEIVSSVGQEILLALDEIAGDQIGLSVLIADRMTRRELPSPNRWALASVLPLSCEQVAKYGGNELAARIGAENLSTPYFLDAAIRRKMVGESPSETLRRFLVDHGGLNADEFQALSAAAFELYVESRTRTFSFDSLTNRVGGDIGRRVLESGAIVRVGAADDSQFVHHLLHDYLAAWYVVRLPRERWVRHVFDAISFDGGSFDSVSMVLSQLKSADADEFLRRLYDWNPYAAGYALSDMTSDNDGPSVEMQSVIFAMLAEKRFDLVGPTREKASDALSLVNARAADPIKACDTMSCLFLALRSIRSSHGWFDEWVLLFITEPEQVIPDADLERIRSVDSIIGWTVANVARRVRLSTQQQESLRSWLTDDSAVVRWRIAHVLGAHPSAENIEALWTLLKCDGDGDVRYGAVRSLVEAAARTGDPALHKLAVERLIERGPSLAAEKRVKDELKRALLVVPEMAPKDWLSALAEIARGVYEMEEDPEEREVWRNYVDMAEIRYRPQARAVSG